MSRSPSKPCQRQAVGITNINRLLVSKGLAQQSQNSTAIGALAPGKILTFVGNRDWKCWNTH
jgi:hypothetical protein